MQKKDKILITGASGMIGSALVRLLRAQGFKHMLTPSSRELDLRHQQAVSAYFHDHKPAYVFHLASIVGGIHANSAYPARFIYDNTLMHCHVIESSYRNGALKLLFPGSACTYPKFAPQPVSEEAFLSGLIEPTNIAYAAAKINGIVMAQSYRLEYGFKTVIPMPANAYGVNDNFDPASSHVIPALMTRFVNAARQALPNVTIWGSGAPLREFIYVDDVAEGLLFLMQHYDDASIINLGTMQEISILELASKIAETVEYKGAITLDHKKPDGAPRKCLDNAKIVNLGWRPHVSLQEGLRRMYQHHFTV